MNNVPASLARWIAFGIRRHLKGIFFDREGDDVVLHFFSLKNKHPPYHRKVLFARNAFEGLDQISDTDFLANKNFDKIQSTIDADLAKEFSRIFSLDEIQTNVKVPKTNDQPEIEFDAYVPLYNLWLEFTTSMKPLDKHFQKKFFEFALIKKNSVLATYKEFDEQSGKIEEKKIKIMVNKMLYFSLFPLGFYLNFEDIKIVSVLDSRTQNFDFLYRTGEHDFPAYLSRIWDRFSTAFREICGII